MRRENGRDRLHSDARSPLDPAEPSANLSRHFLSARWIVVRHHNHGVAAVFIHLQRGVESRCAACNSKPCKPLALWLGDWSLTAGIGLPEIGNAQLSFAQRKHELEQVRRRRVTAAG